MRIWLGGLFTLVLAAFGAASAQAPTGTLVFIGTYTGSTSTSKGIYAARLDPSTGALSAPALAAETRNPSFVAASPDGRFLYAVNEVDSVNGTPGGSITAYAIDKAAGTLTLLNSQSTKGGGPCHVSVAGKLAFVANYGGGSVAAYPIKADGSLEPASAFVQHTGSSVNPDRQKGPHAHAVTPDPTGRFLYVPDLGLDQVKVYGIDAAKGGLTAGTPVAIAPGSGPRHIAISRDGRRAYVINEMMLTVTAFARDVKTGDLNALQTLSTLPAGTTVTPALSTAEVLLHPSGRFLYGSNRGHDSLAVFAVDATNGQLTLVEHVPTGGRTPRAFNIDPSGAFLVVGNQNSDAVVVFRIDPKTGRLTQAGQPTTVGKPVSFEFVH
jgi:6-phosphogluconolactonase